MELSRSIKKGKLIIESGDLFEVALRGDKKGYIQFLYKNDSFLAGHLIRAFSLRKDQLGESNLDHVVASQILFFGFTRIFEGIKEGYWKKVGNKKVELNFESPTFRITKDTKAYVERSLEWYIWKENFLEARKIGALSEEYKGLPFSAIVSPQTIVEWLEAGKQTFAYLPE